MMENKSRKGNLFNRIFGRLIKKRREKGPQDIEAMREKDVQEVLRVLAERGFADGTDGAVKVLDTARFGLDNDSGKVKGIAAVTEERIVSIHIDAETDEVLKVIAVELANVESISVRNGFGVSSTEVLTKDGETFIIGRVDAKESKRFAGFYKRAELYLTDKDVYSRRKKELPENIDGKFDKGKVFKRLMSMASPHKGTIILVTVVYFITMAVSMVEPYLNRLLVDNYINNSGAAEFAKSEPVKVLVPFLITLLMLLLAYVLTLVIGTVRNLIMMKMGLRVVVDLRTKLFDKVQEMSLAGVSKRTTGELMNRISRDSTMLQNFLNTWIPSFLGQALLLVAVSSVLIAIDPMLTVIFVVPLTITIPAIAMFHRKIHKIYGKQWEASSKSGAVLHDILSGIRVVKAFGTEEKESERFGSSARKERDLSIRNEVLFAKLQPFIRIGLLLGNFLLLYYTGDRILGESLTVGQASMITSYVNLVYGPLWWLANFPSMLNRTLVSANRVFEVLDENTDVTDRDDAVDRAIIGNVSFEKVCFGYDETQQVLKNVNLEIKPGEMIGLVGRSGVGKTTLINLMMRLYDVESGAIKIDGIDIRDYSQECLRSQVGAVLQETVLFSGSLFDNIAYAKNDAKKEEVIAAARAAGVHEFAVKLPDGYNTRIGEKGYTLSGGERQRVAIARAILRNPRILILDEATASLDTETEKQIQEAIEYLIKDRTTVAIAHRLSTLRNAAKIVVLDKGSVAEVGTHDELLRRKGLYYDLVVAQRQMATQRK